MIFGPTRIHAQEFAGKQPRFVAAGSGPNFDDGIFVVVGILGQQQSLQLFLKRRSVPPPIRPVPARPVPASRDRRPPAGRCCQGSVAPLPGNAERSDAIASRSLRSWASSFRRSKSAATSGSAMSRLISSKRSDNFGQLVNQCCHRVIIQSVNIGKYPREIDEPATCSGSPSVKTAISAAIVASASPISLRSP